MKKLLVSITGESDAHFKEKIKEIEEKEIETIALFLTRFSPDQRRYIYQLLKEAPVNRIPLVHLRHDMNKEEIKLLEDNFKTDFFTIHEEHFDILPRWKDYKNKLFLEMSTDNEVAENVKVENIGGFCIDLAHYKKQKKNNTVDYRYVYERKGKRELFKCNHISGYCEKEVEDLHLVERKDRFNYLQDLPDFLFGPVMAMEVDNPIEDQLKFCRYIKKILPFEVEL